MVMRSIVAGRSISEASDSALRLRRYLELCDPARKALRRY
jgi:hypothetical protein